MKLLIIILNHYFDEKWSDNIKCLNDYMKNNGMEIDYCGISNQNDFDVYETIIHFKYKIINTKGQISKICDFITDYKYELDYDWYMKFRPDIKLYDNISFDQLSENAINARARVYNGPKIIKYGMSINGEGPWKNIGDCNYTETEHNIILDDMCYIFHKNIVQQNGFEKILPLEIEIEYVHTKIFNERNIPFNIIGINLCLIKYGAFSGDINM
jgi:hypothetical protein